MNELKNYTFELSIERNQLISKDENEKRKYYRNYLHYHQKEILKKLIFESVEKIKIEYGSKCEYDCEYKHKEKQEKSRIDGELYSVGYIKNISEEEIKLIQKEINDKIKNKKGGATSSINGFNYNENEEYKNWYIGIKQDFETKSQPLIRSL